jgi:zinc/manganese transport system substrate-binding protein
MLILCPNRLLPLLAMALLVTACGGGEAASSGSGNSSAVNVVAAENFYGDIVRQLGTGHVNVVSILSDPNADPHEYESSTDNAKAVAKARLVVENGIGYDNFMDKLLSASANNGRIVINAGQVLGKKEGDNPHVWYQVAGMAQLADTITRALQQLDPADQADLATRNERFKASLQPLNQRIDAIKAKYSGSHLTQAEPVFGYMGEALGLQLDNGEFQHAIEEGNDPSPQSVAAIDQEITSHAVKALLYNSQTTSPVTTKLKDLATSNNVPVIGISETEPSGKTYQIWMLSQLDSLQQALGG